MHCTEEFQNTCRAMLSNLKAVESPSHSKHARRSLFYAMSWYWVEFTFSQKTSTKIPQMKLLKYQKWSSSTCLIQCCIVKINIEIQISSRSRSILYLQIHIISHIVQSYCEWVAKTPHEKWGHVIHQGGSQSHSPLPHPLGLRWIDCSQHFLAHVALRSSVPDRYDP